MVVKNYASREAEKVLADVHPDSAFNMKDGSSIKNLQELYSALQNAEHHVFSHHVNEERNDFSNWVRDVHRDYKLANSLSSAKSREDCAKAVASRIYEVQSVLDRRKSKELEERETAAERLEKILSEAAKAKTAEAKKKKDLEESAPAVSTVVDLETKEEIKVTAELPALAPVGPTTEQVLAMGTQTSKVLEERPAEDAQKLIEFAEPKRFHRQFGNEMSSVFSKSALRSFADDMKKMFKSGNTAEDRLVEKLEKPRAPAMKAEKTAKPVSSRPAASDEKKEKIISHLKKVYE